ncbi:hypothetical protein X777_13814 [Ooceraea biroi]|uniref:Uncharacterized protein n=1 Tax=Ooceraea biroi TaxID=2015173 RepID=A0A026VXB1_OOCBI|nr:hypothetical protein X777_13814 [Ooceraea biroi]
MERKGLRKKDILRIDGLLPPTRRLPVCDAVSSTSDKKKDKKWSIGGILRRISSIRDYESSSNDEEIVYCKRTPRKPTRVNRQPNEIGQVVLHSIENTSQRDKQPRIPSNVRQLTDSLHLRRDSLHSRSSDGSLDGFGKKSRKNKLKARAEAKRDHLCAESSSDEDCRRSNSSLNRLHLADAAQNGQRNNACSKRTRAARTERYIKRLSRDDGNGSGDTLNDPYNRRCSSEHNEDKEHAVHVDVNGSCRPPVHPRRFGLHSSNRALPVQKSFADVPVPEVVGDFRRYSTGQYVTDLNQNNTYGKISCNTSGDADASRAGNFFTYPAKSVWHYTEPLDCAIDRRRLINLNNRPPEPPPRDPRYRVYGYGYGSYPANRHQNVPSYFKREGDGINAADGIARADRRNFRSYGSNNEIARYDTAEHEMESSTSPYLRTEFRNSLELTNNKYNSSRHCPIESAYGETAESARCRHRNTRNDQLNCNGANHGAYKAGNKSANICEPNKHRETISSRTSAASPDWPRGRSPCEQRISHSIGPLIHDVDNNRSENGKKENNRAATPIDEALERRRSSKNLEEALFELEAIYNSLRLGDEDLLDRAERRSMEEYSLKQKGRNELDAVSVIASDSPDRTKDDMAYRRMHPKERPTSLSDIAGQSTLSSISYLIASPALSRRDSADDLARLAPTYPSRRDEPDITRDDVVFRSMSHANNTLRVIDPQPPFGIPLGPVTAATESDYLHTIPTKPEQPRSPYIPQCEPDVVTDDLAYRTLRKDAVAVRNVVGAQESRLDEVAREEQRPAASSTYGGMKKKRAVRSLSANLYGLINHDRIHLRREPSLDAIRDEIQDVTRNLYATPERPGYLRRVVSDGELSDNDARRRKEPAVGGEIDINGNHPVMGAYQRKLCVYPTSRPEMTAARESPKKEKESNIAGLSDAVRSSKAAALDDEFWHEYLRSDSDVLATDGDHGTETDFTAYSRLCQDLVNLIKGDDDATPLNKLENDSVVAVVPPDHKTDLKVKTEPLASVGTLGSHYSGSQRANDEQKIKDESAENETAESPSGELTSNRNLDFYLRVADENVKLIAEAFGSVADHLRDSRLSARENSSTSRCSETECQSGSTRSSTLYSQEDRTNDNDGDDDETVARVTPKRDLLLSNEGDQADQGSSTSCSESTSTAELDLSRAVRDLQLAAASLCEHGQEIKDLGIGRGRVQGARVQDATPIRSASSSLSRDENEEDRPIRRLGLIADALKREQERERDQQEAAVDRGIGARGGENARDEEKRRAGERTVCCELDDRARSRRVEDDLARSRVPGITNITNVITKRSMLLLACLLALLLAIVAAS